MNVKLAHAMRGIPKFFEGVTVPTFKLSDDKDFQDMKKLVQGLTTVVQQQNAAIQHMRTQQTTQITQQKTEEEEEEPDMEAMSKKDFAEFLIKNVGKILENKFGEINGRLDGTVKEFRNTKVREQIDKFSGETKDFKEWELEIATLAKTHPTLGIKDLYVLAKASDPDKAKTVETKYAEKKEDEPEDRGLTLFGGYRPSSAKTSGDDGKEPAKLTNMQALEKSWDEAVSKFPALKSMGDDAVD